MPFIHARDVMARTSCHTFERLESQNIELYYLIQDEHDQKRLQIEARDGYEVIATTDLSFDEYSLTPQFVNVEPAYRRRGIATAMYVLAEDLTGLAVIRAVWDEDRSSEAAAFWNQPNRPFGQLT